MAYCKYCDEGWSLGKYGCHYEPVPEDEEFLEEPFIRMQARCLNWEERRKEFYGESQTKRAK